MSKQKQSVIVFDLGNVLISYDYTLTAKHVDNVEKGFGQRFLTFFLDRFDIVKKLEKGEVSSDEFISKLESLFDFKITSEDICKYYSNVFNPIEDVVSLLPKLQTDYKLVLLSNTNEIHEKYGWGDYEFLKCFAERILSHEVGLAKPELEIYTRVMQVTKLAPSHHLLIDDTEANVIAARKIGWDAIHFTDYNILINELNKRNIL